MNSVIYKKRLCCPYCNAMFKVKTGTVGYGPTERDAILGFECSNFKCEAEWDGYASATSYLLRI